MIGAYSAAIFFFILTLTNGYAVFIKGNWDTSNFFSSYITLLVVVVIYITSLTLFKEWGKWQKHPSEVYMLDVLELADAEEEEHKAEFDAKMETRNGFGWKIFYSILWFYFNSTKCTKARQYTLFCDHYNDTFTPVYIKMGKNFPHRNFLIGLFRLKEEYLLFRLLFFSH